MWRWKSVIRGVSLTYWGSKGLQFYSKIATSSYYDMRSTFVPFNKMVVERQNEAKRSLLVQVNSEKSFNELYSYCLQYGTIKGVHHYTLSNNQQFMLVEFDSEECVSNTISSAVFTHDLDVIPVQSQFLWFRPHKNKTQIKNILGPPRSDDIANLIIKNGCKMFSENVITEKLTKASDITKQMEILFKMTQINDLGTRLRYITARQIECALLGLYPKVVVYPFGSTVNGFGKMGCDLDLVMRFTSEDIEDDLKSRLVFHTKKSTLSVRMQQQRYMEIVSDIVQLFIPGCSQVRRILQARIPIIKYKQDYAGLECDLSINSLSGLHMSELLYIYGNFDSRVKPLVFTIRKWASNVGLTNPSPGKWITNFPLTLMVLFYLQNAENGPILPSFNYLKSCAGKDDTKITDDGVDCTFARDIRKVDFNTTNTDSLEDLLRQFFAFYSLFDFSQEAISINEGTPIKKPEYAPLYIINPLESNLNVSKNVSFDECERIKLEFRNASWYMESYDKNNTSDKWGLGVLLIDKNHGLQQKFTDQYRLVSVKDLFVDNISNKSEVNINMTNIHLSNFDEEGLEKKSEVDNVIFKNDQVKKEVEKIKEETKEMIKTHLTDPDDGSYETKVTHRRRLRRR